MDDPQRRNHPHLFTLRLWAEKEREGQTEWRVQLQNVATGESRYFRDWPTLIHLLVAMLPAESAEEGQGEEDREERANAMWSRKDGHSDEYGGEKTIETEKRTKGKTLSVKPANYK